MDKQNITNEELLKMLEDRLLDNSIVQNRIQELTDKLYTVNRKLKLAESYKGHFISNITNEIVNPFASILLLSKNIQKLADGEMAKANKMAELISHEAFQLDFQLKNIFAAAMIESGKEVVVSGKTNVLTLMNSVIEYFEDAINDKQLQVNVNTNGNEYLNNFLADASKLDLILKNLISNAVKFSHAGGKIEVSLTADDDHVEIAIRDYGKGVPEKDRSEIFDRFKQVDERVNSANSGHGLGLSIVKSYCQLLNAQIDVQFPTDGGTHIMINLGAGIVDEQSEELSDFMIDDGEKF